jgi:hypothetical protein
MESSFKRLHQCLQELNQCVHRVVLYYRFHDEYPWGLTEKWVCLFCGHCEEYVERTESAEGCGPFGGVKFRIPRDCIELGGDFTVPQVAIELEKDQFPKDGSRVYLLYPTEDAFLEMVRTQLHIHDQIRIHFQRPEWGARPANFDVYWKECVRGRSDISETELEEITARIRGALK